MVEQSSQLPSEQVVCDGHTLKLLAQAGRDWLDTHHPLVNQLNVFPVPDGDTGTNMLMTMRNAVKEAIEVDSDAIGQIAARIAHGAVMGSRGNSGTILSQLWQGFAHALKDQRTLNAELLVRGLREAADTAYRGVIKPVEGTILTVAREAAEEAERAYQDTHDIVTIMTRAVDQAKDALARTPQMLPILQKAGVVDSGGSGLVFIMEGMLRYARGQEVTLMQFEAAETEDLAAVLAPEDEQGYGYDVQFILKGENLDVNTVRAVIDQMGWSTLVVGDEEAIKVHVHVHDPGRPISYGISLGTLSDIIVENMQEQFHDYVRERGGHPGHVDHISVPAAHSQIAIESPELNEDDIGIVAVASGDGLARVFRQLGAAQLVMGGQTNNPSTQEIYDAIVNVPAKRVIVLPNNKNIILAAEQAARLVTDKHADREVIVLPTRTMPQGISALLPYDPKGDLDEVSEAMLQAKDDVRTGEITTATRSVELDGVNVTEGQIIGLVDGKLTASGDSIIAVMRDILDQMCGKDCELITLYYGNGLNEAEARQLVDEMSQDYPNQDFELVNGGQAHYHYILSVE
ncbi:MAG: DAK2 domain-containing protein [Chloroflexi bacterium]|nr:DAK2 domain-containing protein [Chloroflexota bacterium]